MKIKFMLTKFADVLRNELEGTWALWQKDSEISIMSSEHEVLTFKIDFENGRNVVVSGGLMLNDRLNILVQPGERLNVLSASASLANGFSQALQELTGKIKSVIVPLLAEAKTLCQVKTNKDSLLSAVV